MATIQDAKNAVHSTLSGMGYNPYSLLITELVTDSKDGYWQIKGEFQNGFVGDPLKFELMFDPLTHGIRSCKVSPTSSHSGYA